MDQGIFNFTAIFKFNFSSSSGITGSHMALMKAKSYISPLDVIEIKVG
jgi:hypothetical protein